MRLFLSLFILTHFVSPDAFGGEWDEKCRAAAEQAKAKCEAEKQAVNAADQSRSAATGATAAARGPTQNANAGDLSSNIAAQNAALKQAIPKCEADKKDCEQKCDQAKSEAQPHNKPNDPRQAEAAGDVGKIPATKQSVCIAPIMAIIAGMESGQAPLPGQNGQSDATKSASAGGAPMMMPPMPKDDKKDDAKSDQPPTAAPPVNCAAAGGSRYSVCNDAFVTTCASNPTAPECGSFSGRYCNISGSAPTTAPVTSLQGGQMVTADQVGEGVGSAYCKQAISYDFCVNHTGRDSCLTCMNYRASQTQGCSAHPELCVTDNSPDQVANSRCPVAEPLLGGGAATGVAVTGPAPGAATGATGGKPPVGTITPESHVQGGLSSGSGDNAEDAKNKNSGLTIMSVGAIRGTTNSRAPAAVDVASQYGRSLFNIGSETYQTMCASGRLNCGHR